MMTPRSTNSPSLLVGGGRPHSFPRNILQHRQPSVLLFLHESKNLLGRHGARTAADKSEPLLEIRTADHFGEVDADLADDRRRRAERRHQHLPAPPGKPRNG